MLSLASSSGVISAFPSSSSSDSSSSAIAPLTPSDDFSAEGNAVVTLRGSLGDVWRRLSGMSWSKLTNL